VAQLAAYLATLGPDYAQVFENPARLRAAVNKTHARFDAPVSDVDEVAFFPPVTGG
jgi:molybdopterin synthase sulfur carrier subunit